MAESNIQGVKNSPGGAGASRFPAVAKNGGRAAPDLSDPLLDSMRPDELRSVMDALGCGSQAALARAIGVDRSTVSLWLDGWIGVPRPIAKLLRLLQIHEGRDGWPEA